MSDSLAPDISGRVALVTGANAGIGLVTARELARRGAHVFLACRSASHAQAALNAIRAASGNQKVEALALDLGDFASVRQCANAFLARGLPLHLLVNNASLFEYDNAQSFAPERFEQHLQTNLIAPVELTMALHRHHSQQGGKRSGHVVTLLDQKLENLNVDYLSYTLAKLGSGASIRYLAQCCAPYLRVNAIGPGVTLVSGDMTPDEFERSQKIAALGKSSTPQDIAMAVLMLDEAVAVTGQTLLVDGGQHLVPRQRDVAFENKDL